jgi:hypothetical protein
MMKLQDTLEQLSNSNSQIKLTAFAGRPSSL